MKNYNSLNDALKDLRQRGYTANFKTQKVCLYCGDLDMRLDPQDFNVDESYRFPENINGVSCLLLAITSSGGLKGTLLDDYNTGPANINEAMMEKLNAHIQHAISG
ncbi:phosphoribosylpyrophosphate synthetase [Parafilimonas terrae]|jgi:hypothetical protein|uniref:Phosphoribosylpyrophosphate synthetase n=1 Tax=Parafilimonas terrae TaxID=1465490 RepID=A0A1I5V5J1_9BACT|nr:phosphoribosylpyrophosphate synthetase [Parafilimonas terrae]SFQ02804.1 hypothetical protein SAMN05444277_104227 [Parafilimonas terrae]